MVFDEERQELIEIFKINHLKKLNNFESINNLITKHDDKEFSLLSIALTNIKYFLSRPRYFYAILDILAFKYDDINYIKLNEVKIAFEILKTICFNLLKPITESCFREYSRIKRSNGQAEYLHELFDSDLVDAIFHEIGYKINKFTDTYEFMVIQNDARQNLIDIAFDSYLNYYFYDNIVCFISSRKLENECEPLKLIEFLLENEGKFNYLDHNKIYNEFTLVKHTDKVDEQSLINEENIFNENQDDENVNNEIIENKKKLNNTDTQPTLYRILTNEQWSCANCTYLNDPDKTTCVLCYSAKNLPYSTFL